MTATAINDKERVVGVGTFDGAPTAFVMDLSNGTINSLGTLGAELNYVYTPTSVNTGGLVVGTGGLAVAGDPDPTHLDAARFLVFTDTMLAWNAYVLVPTGWVLASAVGINVDNNEIAGIVINKMTLTHIERRAFKVQAFGLPTAEELACVGKVEGDSL